MNNQSKKPENLEPQDSTRKDISHPENDSNAVINHEDEVYKKDEAEFRDPAKVKEDSEQPINSVNKGSE